MFRTGIARTIFGGKRILSTLGPRKTDGPSVSPVVFSAPPTPKEVTNLDNRVFLFTS